MKKSFLAELSVSGNVPLLKRNNNTAIPAG
jgi:hypothetical protein